MAVIILSILCIILACTLILVQQRHDKTIRQLTDEADSLRHEVAQANTSLSVSQANLTQANLFHQKELDELRAFHAKEIERIESAHASGADSFKVLAAEIMKENTRSMMEQNQAQVGTLLSPLKDDIERFRKQVADCYNAESRERFSLQDRIRELVEANASIGREARELATALRGNSKTQGDWGEFLLESILEQSGLREGSEFFVQATSDDGGQTTLRDAAGRGLRPDVVVRYPGDLSVVIDSKVSLTAYVEYVNADSEEARAAALKSHLVSVNRHIAELAAKNYQDYVGVNRLDFVMMFVPNEGAYAAAMTEDATMWQKAFEKRVLIVSPVQLVASLRIVRQIWTHDAQTRNTIRIAKEAGDLYDKFTAFVDDMQKIESTLASAQKACTTAINKLCEGRGNVVRRIENLKTLGVKADKSLRAVLRDRFDTACDSDEDSPDSPQSIE